MFFTQARRVCKIWVYLHLSNRTQLTAIMLLGIRAVGYSVVLGIPFTVDLGLEYPTPQNTPQT